MRLGTAAGGTSPGPGGTPTKLGRERCWIVGLETRNSSKNEKGSVSANRVRCVSPLVTPAAAADDDDMVVMASRRSASYVGNVRFLKERIERKASARASWKEAPCAGGYAGMTRVVTRAARCGAVASRATHASVSSSSELESTSVR